MAILIHNLPFHIGILLQLQGVNSIDFEPDFHLHFSLAYFAYF